MRNVAFPSSGMLRICGPGRLLEYGRLAFQDVQSCVYVHSIALNLLHVLFMYTYTVTPVHVHVHVHVYTVHVHFVCVSLYETCVYTLCMSCAPNYSDTGLHVP